MVLLGTTLHDVNHTVPDILTPQDSCGFQYQCKNAKNEDFLISSIISTAVNFKFYAVFLSNIYIIYIGYASCKITLFTCTI